MARKAAKKATTAKRAKKAPKAAGSGSKSSAARTSGALAIKDVRELIRLMTDNDLSELCIEQGQRKISLKRGTVGPVMVAGAGAPAAVAAAPPAAVEEELLEIKSPMVGTFYPSPSPDSDAYVSVGDVIGPDDVVAVVEAMKVMNEIKAECAGAIVEVCVKSAQPVEFGQVMFRVRPQ